VAAGDDRHGRRDNGLVAAEYAAAGDVDPRVGEHLLDVLALDGIAAYLRPTTDLHPVTRTTSLPDRPTDRLYVDREHLATARAYMARLAAEASRDEEEPDLDDAWAEIVAGYDAEVAEPERTWPSAEDLSGEEPPDRPEPPEPPEPSRGTRGLARSSRPIELGRPGDGPRDEPSLLDGLDTFGADLPDGDEEGYTPPAPPPVPRPTFPTVLGVIGIIGGLVVFLKPEVLPIGADTALILGFLAILGGFVTLVWRLRPGGEDDDTDPDNGARV